MAAFSCSVLYPIAKADWMTAVRDWSSRASGKAITSRQWVKTSLTWCAVSGTHTVFGSTPGSSVNGHHF